MDQALSDEGFWKKKSLVELAQEQGFGPVSDATLDELIGAGRDLWNSNEDFERFVAEIYQRRRESQVT